MKKIIVLFLALILLTAAAMVWKPRAKPETSTNILPDFNPENVTMLTISSPENSVTLQKSNDLWTVREKGNFPGDPDRIASLLFQAWDAKPAQKIEVEKSQLGRLQLAAPTDQSSQAQAAIRVQFFDESGKLLAALLLGKNQMTPNQGGLPGTALGRYVKLDGEDPTVFLTKETFSEALPSPSTWLDPALPKMIDPEFVEYSFGQDSWKILAEGDSWKLAPLTQPENFKSKKQAKAAKPSPSPAAPEFLDLAKIIPFLAAWNSPKLVDVVPDSADADHGLQNSRTLTFVEKDGSRITYSFGEPQGATFPARIQFQKNNEPTGPWSSRVILLPATLFSAIPTSRKDLLPSPPSPSPTPAPTPARKKSTSPSLSDPAYN